MVFDCLQIRNESSPMVVDARDTRLLRPSSRAIRRGMTRREQFNSIGPCVSVVVSMCFRSSQGGVLPGLANVGTGTQPLRRFT